MELLVIRHGQTDWNAEKRIQGAADIQLSFVGRRQYHIRDFHIALDMTCAVRRDRQPFCRARSRDLQRQKIVLAF